RPPVMHHQNDVLGDLQLLKPGVHVSSLVDEAVGLGGRFARPAHTYEIRRQTPGIWAHMRDDVTPLVGPGGIAVQKDDWIAAANVDVTDLGVEDFDTSPREVVGPIRLDRRNGGVAGRSANSSSETAQHNAAQRSAR